MSLSAYGSTGLLKKNPLLGSSYGMADPEGAQTYMGYYRDATRAGAFGQGSKYEAGERKALQEEIRTTYDKKFAEDPGIRKMNERVGKLDAKYVEALNNIDYLENISRRDYHTDRSEYPGHGEFTGKPSSALDKPPVGDLNKKLERIGQKHGFDYGSDVYGKIMDKFRKIAEQRAKAVAKEEGRIVKREDKVASKDTELWESFNKKTQVLNSFFG
jgi:hypothetical protein